jgi:high-affinity Fe2+/Pb2+ permease
MIYSTMDELYQKKGQSVGAVGAVISLITGIGVAVLVLIFVGVLGGQTYNLAEADIDNISDATIKGHVKGGITSGFEALEQTGSYLPLIVLAIIIALVLSLVLGMSNAGAGMGRGGAL